jgi:virulence factor Mce-like protein
MTPKIGRPNFGGNKNFWLGILGGLLVLAVVVGASLFKVAGVGDKNIDVEFAQAAGMRSGDKVRVAGIEMGRVKSAKIEGDHVLATFQVKKNLKFGPDAHASIKQASILGQVYVDLVPGDGSGLPGNRIPISNSSVPFSLSKLVKDPKYPSQFDRLEQIDGKKLADSINVLGAQLGDSPKLAVQAMDSVGVLAKVVNQRRDEVDSLLKNLDKVSTIMSDNRNSILLILAQGQAIGQRVMERQQLVQTLLANVATLSKQLQDIGAENNGQLAPLLQDLNTLGDGLTKNKENLDHILQIAPVTLRAITDTFGNGPYFDGYLPWLIFSDNQLCWSNPVTHLVPGGCQ